MLENRKTIFIGVIVALVILVGGFDIQERAGKNLEEPIKIGVLGPFSGVLARFGEWTQRGAQIAVDEINTNGGIGGQLVEVIFEDDECLPSKAVSAVNKLQNINDIDIFVSYCTNTSSAIAPVTEGRSIVFAPTFKLPQLREAGHDHYIAMQPTMLFEVTKLFEYIKEQGFQKAGILYTTVDFWTAYKNAFTKLADENGVEIVAIEEADFLANDFRTQLVKINSTEPDVIFGGLNPGPLGNMMKQKEELRIDTSVVGIWGTEAPDLLERGGSATNGIVYTYYYENGFTEKNEKYVEAYRNKYEEMPELISASTYDIFFILKRAIEKCGGENRECIIDEVNEIEDYEGASGIITFDNSSTIKEVFLKTIRDGEFVRLVE